MASGLPFMASSATFQPEKNQLVRERQTTSSLHVWVVFNSSRMQGFARNCCHSASRNGD